MKASGNYLARRGPTSPPFFFMVHDYNEIFRFCDSLFRMHRPWFVRDLPFSGHHGNICFTTPAHPPEKNPYIHHGIHKGTSLQATKELIIGCYSSGLLLPRDPRRFFFRGSWAVAGMRCRFLFKIIGFMTGAVVDLCVHSSTCVTFSLLLDFWVRVRNKALLWRITSS